MRSSDTVPKSASRHWPSASRARPRIVASPEKAQLAIVERLHAEADGGDAQSTPLGHRLPGDVLGVRFEKDPGVVAQRKIGAHRIEKATELGAG